MSNSEQRCKNCGSWVKHGALHSSGWCVSDMIAKGQEEFQDNSIMCHCEDIRSRMDDTFLVTGAEYGCVNYKPKD